MSFTRAIGTPFYWMHYRYDQIWSEHPRSRILNKPASFPLTPHPGTRRLPTIPPNPPTPVRLVAKHELYSRQQGGRSRTAADSRGVGLGVGSR